MEKTKIEVRTQPPGKPRISYSIIEEKRAERNQKLKERLRKDQDSFLDKNATREQEVLRRNTMLTVAEVADLIRISRYSIYNLVKRGELPALKILNKLRFTHEDVESYLSQQRVKSK